MSGQYKDAWARLKSLGKVVIASPRSFHPRIIRAIRKEKYKDTMYKFVLSEKNQRAIFTSKSEGNKITLFLRIEAINLSLTEI